MSPPINDAIKNDIGQLEITCQKYILHTTIFLGTTGCNRPERTSSVVSPFRESAEYQDSIVDNDLLSVSLYTSICATVRGGRLVVLHFRPKARVVGGYRYLDSFSSWLDLSICPRISVVVLRRERKRDQKLVGARILQTRKNKSGKEITSMKRLGKRNSDSRREKDEDETIGNDSTGIAGTR